MSEPTRKSFTVTAGLTLLAAITLAIWFGPVASGNSAQANHQVAIGIDTNTSGNSALALGASLEACRVITVGQILDVDLYVTGLSDLASWEAYIKYDQSKLVITKPGSSAQNNNDRFLLQQAQPSPPGNNVVNTSESLPDTLNAGIYRVGAYDQVVIPGFEDPDPIGHTHKDGVLVRLQVQGAGAGFSQFQITPISTPAGLLGPFLRASNGTLVGDGNGDGFIDNVSNGSFVIGAGTCSDTDGDGIPDTSDNCPTVANADQANFDGIADGGDACDTDDDNDGLLDVNEPANCAGHLGRLDFDCDDDNISDGNLDPDSLGPVIAGPDNCVTTANTNQLNTDADALGNVCDPDDDNDTILDGNDNCPLNSNQNQANFDSIYGDTLGDACDTEDDGDGYTDTAEAWVGTLPLDNCGNQATSGPVFSLAWPADLASSGISLNKINLTDLSSFIAPVKRFNTSPGDANYHQRWDLVPGSTGGKKINLIDMSSITTSNPLMFAGARAFSGPTCTP